MNKKFKDNATRKIIAFDFDNTISKGDIFPEIGKPREYAKQVIDLLYELGVAIVVWTCRDRSLPRSIEDEYGAQVIRDHDDLKPMKQWLSENEIKYHSINSCIEHAPFHYEARKIYAHMYVDDKGFGWDNDNEEIMLDVMAEFLHKHMNYEWKHTQYIRQWIICGIPTSDIIYDIDRQGWR